MATRYVLYDYDEEKLMTGHLYADRAEAEDDADEISNAIVLPLEVPDVNIHDTDTIEDDGEGEWWHEDDD